MKGELPHLIRDKSATDEYVSYYAHDPEKEIVTISVFGHRDGLRTTRETLYLYEFREDPEKLQEIREKIRQASLSVVRTRQNNL